MPSNPSPLPSSRDAVVAYNVRLGVALFAVYLLLYVGFIYLNAFSRQTMAADAVGGVNVAVLYGFGLIVAAFVLAIVYMLLCRREEPPTNSPTSSDAEGGK